MVNRTKFKIIQKMILIWIRLIIQWYTFESIIYCRLQIKNDIGSINALFSIQTDDKGKKEGIKACKIMEDNIIIKIKVYYKT